MTQQPVAFLILVPALVGHGLLWSRLFHRAVGGDWSVPGANPALVGIAGVVGVSTLATGARFLVPISPPVSAALAALGWGLLLGHRRWIAASLSPERVAVLAVTALTLCFLMMTRSHFQWVDTGLYHWPTIKWIVERPIAFGLANLHFRLGFNSSWFVFGATAHLPKLGLEGVFALNGIFLFLAVSALFLELQSRLASERALTLPSAFLVTLLGLYALRFQSLLTSQVGAIGNDGAVAFCYLVATYLVLAWRRSGRPDALAHLLAVALLALLVKPTGVALPLGAAGVVAFRISRRDGAARLARRARGALAIGALVLLPWMARSYALTGCFAYPAAATCVLRPAWGIPPAEARETAVDHRDYARYGRGYERVRHQPARERLAVWWARLASSRTLAAGLNLAVLGVAGLGLSGPLRRRLRYPRARAAEGLAFSAFCVGFWLLWAPGRRFGLGQVLALGVLLASLALFRFAPAARRWLSARGALGGVRAARLSAAVIPLLLCVVLARLGLEIHARRADAGSWRLALLREEELPSPPYRLVESASGHPVHVSTRRLCWDTPLPCARSRAVARRIEVGRFLGRDLYRRGPT